MQHKNELNKAGLQPENTDYKRDGLHLGEGSSSNTSDTNAGTQKGGGGTGYDVDREQHEVNKQQEEMQQERNLDDVQPEPTQVPQPDVNPGRETPLQNPDQPETRPGTSTMGSLDRNVNGAWSQSSWDSNSIR
ncbi:MAG TPA: hypothetical protein PL009_07675 [Flavipsychrobacter sp.]|nr:hypothetical protein [Flavipsychrobacter sp.]